jgi:S1-C subfamily serine protease
MDDTTFHQSLTAALTGAVARLDPSIATVHGRRGYPLSGVAWRDDLLVTTHRAVGRDESVEVAFGDGERIAVELVGSDPSTDLALLRLAEPVIGATKADVDGLAVGTPLLRLARPRGGLRASFGLMSANEGPWRSARGGRIDRLVISDARAARGFSGGPLATLGGDVVGITTRALANEPVAIPIATIERTIATLLEHGHIPRGYLGLTGQPLPLPSELREVAGAEAGLLITSVESGGPAAVAGLTLGDTLLTLGGEAIAHPGAVAALLGPETVGAELQAGFLRGGKLKSVGVSVGERPRGAGRGQGPRRRRHRR